MKDRSREFDYYTEANPYAQRPPRDVAGPKLHEMLDEAITYAYVTGSIGATVSTNTPDYEIEVSYKITRLGGAK